MSETITRVITREQAEEWDLSYDAPGKLADEFIEKRRWYSWRRVIFTAPDDGLTYAASYRDPASEIQEDLDPWDDAKEVTLTRYESYEKTVTAWRPAGSGT
jgi:hypothetical protein